jgi:hypothetical protein
LKACFNFYTLIKAFFILKYQYPSRLSYGDTSAAIRYPIPRALFTLLAARREIPEETRDRPAATAAEVAPAHPDRARIMP